MLLGCYSGVIPVEFCFLEGLFCQGSANASSSGFGDRLQKIVASDATRIESTCGVHGFLTKIAELAS
jgi:hypothetical protein